MKKSEFKIINLVDELSEKQIIFSDLNSTSSKAELSYKVSLLPPGHSISQIKCMFAITDEIIQKPSINYSTTPKKTSNLAENNNLFTNICNSIILDNKLKLPVTVPKQSEKSCLFCRLAPLKTSFTSSTYSSSDTFSSNTSEPSPPIHVSNPLDLLELEDNSSDNIEVEEVDSKY